MNRERERIKITKEFADYWVKEGPETEKVEDFLYMTEFVNYTNLGKQYQEFHIILGRKSDGKLFELEYIQSEYNGRYVENFYLIEVFAKTVTKTEYE